MTFRLVDRSTWGRSEYFDQYFKQTPCSYSMTLNLDLTVLLRELKQQKLKLYPAMIYFIATIVNRHEEFRMALDEQGQVGIFDLVHPSYTIFQKEGKTFTNLWTQYSPSFTEFHRRYLLDVEKFGEVKSFLAKPACPENSFTISSIPWVSFTGFNLNLPTATEYLLPIFTTGKYFEQTGRVWLPFALQVHHAVCDGFHAARFVNELQEAMNSGEIT